MAGGLPGFIQGYHHDPDPEAALAWLTERDMSPLLAAGDEATRTHRLAVLTAFFAQVLKGAPAPLVGTLPDRLPADRPDNAMVAALAIAMADLPHSGRLLVEIAKAGRLEPKLVASIRKRPPFRFDRLRAQSPYDLDLLWVSFFATGEAVYIERIAEAVVPPRPPDALPADDPAAAALAEQRTAVAVLAHETLTRGAATHSGVRRALDRLARSRDDRVGGIAGTIAAAAESGDGSARSP